MNTSDLISVLAEKWDMTQADTRELIDIMFEILNDNLAQGKTFTIPDLGTFSVHTRNERRSYNPHYEQYMMLPPKRVVDFTASKNLKEDVKDLEDGDE